MQFRYGAVALSSVILLGAGAATLMAQQDADATAGQVAQTGANLFAYDDADAVQQGRVIYAAQCAACHGDNLQGQDNWRMPGSNGRALAPPHDTTGHTWHHPDPQLFAIVKYGTAAIVGNGYESDMAGYADVLTDAEIRNVMAFIKSTWPDDIIDRHNAMNTAAANP